MFLLAVMHIPFLREPPILTEPPISVHFFHDPPLLVQILKIRPPPPKFRDEETMVYHKH